MLEEAFGHVLHLTPPEASSAGGVESRVSCGWLLFQRRSSFRVESPTSIDKSQAILDNRFQS